MLERLRSLLYVPASRPEMLRKVGSLPLAADAFVIDLEDGVAPSDKAEAREHVAQAARDNWLGLFEHGE